MLSLQHGQITADEVFAMLQSEPIALPSGNIPWPEQGAWTYADYLRLPEDGLRYEIIEGEQYIHAVGSASITSTVFPDLSLPLAELFPGEAKT